jgi:hypothetical protein
MRRQSRPSPSNITALGGFKWHARWALRNNIASRFDTYFAKTRCVAPVLRAKNLGLGEDGLHIRDKFFEVERFNEASIEPYYFNVAKIFVGV